MQAGKGYYIDLIGVALRPSTACVLAESFVAVTPLEGGLRLAGTIELSGTNDRLMAERLDQLLIGARNYLKDLGSARTEATGLGLRPLSADGLPIIGWAPGVEGVFIATGHAMMGFLLGPWTGKLASEAILDARLSIDRIPSLLPDRF
jgi:D-amino-acid dehydrogenase